MTENEIDLEALSTTEPGRIAPTAQQALARIEAAVDDHLREMDEVFGAEPPTPLTEQNYSGRFLVRTSRAYTRASFWRPLSRVSRSTSGWRRNLLTGNPTWTGSRIKPFPLRHHHILRVARGLHPRLEHP